MMEKLSWLQIGRNSFIISPLLRKSWEKERESNFGGRSKIITQRMEHEKDALGVAWSESPACTVLSVIPQTSLGRLFVL